jgi:hypothetical protein
MPNITGLFSRFRKPAVGAIPQSNAVRINTANANLEHNMKEYVNSYVKNRNSPNKVPVLNKKLVNNLHRYINAKRFRVAGAAAGAVATAPAPVQAAAANAAVQTPPAAPPANVGANVVTAVNKAGGTAAEAANAGMAAAAEVARQQNKNAKLAALITLLNTYKGKNNTWYANQKLNVLKSQLNNASRNVNLNNNSRERLNIVRSRISAAQNVKSPQPRGALLLTESQRQNNQSSRPNLEKTIKAPNGRNITVIRANNKARWNFKSNANKSKYNLNNRNQPTPTIRNVNMNGSALFNQKN